MPVSMGQTCFTFDEYLRRKTEPNPIGQLFETGDITAFEHADDYSYTYVCGNATAAYNSPGQLHAAKGRTNQPKIDLFTRSMAWLGNRYLVVFDRVSALDASYRKAWLCHFQGEPKVSGKLLAAAVPGHIEDYDGDTVTATWADGVLTPPAPADPGRLLIRTLLPREHTIRRIGGAGYEFWSNGANRPPRSNCGGLQDMGRWRIEVSPARPARFDNFLHLLYPCDTRTDRMPASELVSAEGDKAVGLTVGGWLVMFGRTGEVAGELAYPAPAGKTEHLVADLPRGAKYRAEGIVAGPKELTVSREGTVRFATDAKGAVRLTPIGK